MKHLYPVGTPVLVIGNPSKHSTYLGLFGYVSAIYTDDKKPDEPASYHVRLLKYPTLDEKREEQKENEGRFEDSLCFCRVTDLRALTDAKQLKRVEAFKVVGMKEDRRRAKEPKDEVIESIMRDMDNPDKRRERIKTDKLIEANAKLVRREKAFQLPGKIERGDKAGFPAYMDTREIDGERMAYAQSEKPVKELTMRERARWKVASEIIDQCSFWHPSKEVRAAVKEFDLDPYADQFNEALYIQPYKNHVYAVAGTVRAEIVKLWNAGAIILDIDGAKDAETCADRDDRNPPAYFIRYGMRRVLPSIE